MGCSSSKQGWCSAVDMQQAGLAVGVQCSCFQHVLMPWIRSTDGASSSIPPWHHHAPANSRCMRYKGLDAVQLLQLHHASAKHHYMNATHLKNMLCTHFMRVDLPYALFACAPAARPSQADPRIVRDYQPPHQQGQQRSVAAAAAGPPPRVKLVLLGDSVSMQQLLGGLALVLSAWAS